MTSTDHAAPNLPVTAPNKGVTDTPSAFEPKLRKELSRLDSSIPFRPQTRYLHHTWAQTFFARPEFFFQPQNVAELQKIVTVARRLNKRLCVTGFGHSPSDLSLTSSWLINLDALSEVLETGVGGRKGLVRFEAGISLHDLNVELAKHGLTLPNLGSIDVQSVAGSIATGTHGSSLKHGMLSDSITSLKIMLSNAKVVDCSAEKNPELFRAALVSLGALGIITEITFQAVPDFNISWSQKLFTLDHVLSTWDTTLWEKEYTRVWWMPYMKRAVIWSADPTSEPVRHPQVTFYGGKFGYYLYHNLLYLSHWTPRILPWVEWLIFGMQYGFKPGSFEMTAVQPVREGLLMDCLYSQFVNEWALPLEKGPEAITRLSAWINGDEKASRIPYSSKGLWVHCPIEVRVSDTNTDNNINGVRPYLSPPVKDGPTLYLNATLYRPYGKDPPCVNRYYEAFEWLMKDVGARPHWAKNFMYTERDDIEAMYGDDMKEFMKIRDESDPQGLFIGQWHQRNLPISETIGLEVEETRRKMGRGWGDGVLWIGRQLGIANAQEEEEDGQKTPSPPLTSTTSTSEESFDYMAKGEASVYNEIQEMGG